MKTALVDATRPIARSRDQPGVLGDGSGTRSQVARSLLERGPQTAAVLAERLGLTPAAVRRHLDGLLAEGAISAREPRVTGPRGRGRPAKVFALTDAGRDTFEAAYDTLAVSALRFLAETGGDQLVAEFARRQVAGVEARLAAVGDASNPPEALAAALTSDGYAASLHQLPGGGAQLCQHHCPVAHVAAAFPQLCEAETEAFARILGTHVQRLATIAHGDGVCTTHIPPPVRRASRTASGTSTADQSATTSAIPFGASPIHPTSGRTLP